MKTVVVILPTYNEKGSIESLIDEIFKQNKLVNNWEIHVLVVDSQSPDKTSDLVKKLKKKYQHLHLLVTPKEGLGKAYTKGFTYAFDKINPYLIIQMDADGQHDPKKIPEFIHEIERGADFVVGTRYSKGGSIPQNWGIHRKILSIGANLIIKLGFMKLNITEWTNGYRAIKSWIIKNAFSHIKNYSGYVFHIAMLDYALKNNAKMAEIPVHFKERKSGISKINALQYISQILFYVFTHSSFIKFVIVGGIGFVIDFGISYLGINVLKTSIALITIISTETAIISNFLLNNFWSFAHKKLDGSTKSLLLNFLKFNLVSSGSIIIQTLGVSLLSNIFGSHLWYVYKVVIIAFVIIPYSYILYNKVIWKKK